MCRPEVAGRDVTRRDVAVQRQQGVMWEGVMLQFRGGRAGCCSSEVAGRDVAVLR